MQVRKTDDRTGVVVTLPNGMEIHISASGKRGAHFRSLGGCLVIRPAGADGVFFDVEQHEGGEIEVEFEGKLYEADYEVFRGILTVSTANGSKSAQIGSSPPEALAQLLLRELIQDGKA